MKKFKDLNIDFKGCSILLDIDGTITYDGGSESSACKQKILEIKMKQNEIYLCSNGKNKNRIVKMSEELEVKYINSDLKKPNKRIIDNTSLEKKDNIIVIGDKFLTDGILARNLKSRFIKVERLRSKNDLTIVKLINFLDDVFHTIFNFISASLRIIRLNHWIKNLLIFAPVFFGGKFLDISNLLQSIRLFFAFSFLASTVYVFNDLQDKNEDKLHVSKKNRPLASGEMSVKGAVILMLIMFLIVIVLSLSLPFSTIAILGTYVVLNLLYSTLLKHIPILDIFLVASLYLIRIYAGGSLLNIHISSWLILCTFFLALFLIVAKRKAELMESSNGDFTRKVLKLYNSAFLDQMLTIATTLCLVTYAFYLLSFDDNGILYAFFFVLLGVMRYLYLIYRHNVGETPEKVVVKDPFLGIVIIGWIFYNAYFLYYL